MIIISHYFVLKKWLVRNFLVPLQYLIETPPCIITNIPIDWTQYSSVFDRIDFFFLYWNPCSCNLLEAIWNAISLHNHWLYTPIKPLIMISSSHTYGNFSPKLRMFSSQIFESLTCWNSKICLLVHQSFYCLCWVWNFFQSFRVLYFRSRLD
jgi:hypothetical protein